MQAQTESIKYFLSNPPQFNFFIHLTYRVFWWNESLKKQDCNNIQDRLLFTINLN